MVYRRISSVAISTTTPPGNTRLWPDRPRRYQLAQFIPLGASPSPAWASPLEAKWPSATRGQRQPGGWDRDSGLSSVRPASPGQTEMSALPWRASLARLILTSFGAIGMVTQRSSCSSTILSMTASAPPASVPRRSSDCTTSALKCRCNRGSSWWRIRFPVQRYWRWSDRGDRADRCNIEVRNQLLRDGRRAAVG